MVKTIAQQTMPFQLCVFEMSQRRHIYLWRIYRVLHILLPIRYLVSFHLWWYTDFAISWKQNKQTNKLNWTQIMEPKWNVHQNTI